MASKNLWAIGFEFGFGIVASVLGVATGPVEAAILECQAAVAAEILATNACDPDPCRTVEKYWLLAEPNIPERRYPCRSETLKLLFEGRISARTVALFQEGLDLMRKVPAYQLAVFETCCRAHSAKVKGDGEAERNQLRYKQVLIDETLRLRHTVADHWEKVIEHLRTNRITGRLITGYENFLAALEKQGFPELEIGVMKSYGMTDADIERVRHIMLSEFHIKDAPRTVDEAILANILVYRHRDFKCDCA